MPLQNRVNPYGDVFRTQARGSMMGNRGGVLHNDQYEIVRDFKSRRWITCLLEFKNRHRVVMSPRRYTELFFLDEAVALAAGHRPCAECRREQFNAFRDAWRKRSGVDHLPMADEMDVELHTTRIGVQRPKVTYEATLDSLPDGTFVRVDKNAYLLFEGALLLWSPEGYVRREAYPQDEIVAVLTPKPIVECFRHGYKASVHESAMAVK
jgi:hypothetical protein